MPIRRGGAKDPLLLIHGVDGDVVRFHKLARSLEPDQPVYGIKSQALVGVGLPLTRVEEMAAYYVREVQAVQPHGPYHFLGFSFGGLVAFEMARQLHSQAEQVGMLGMLDTAPMVHPATLDSAEPIQNRWGRRWERTAVHIKRLWGPEGLVYVMEKVRARSLRAVYTLLDAIGVAMPRALQSAYDINWFAAVHYSPQFFPGRVTLFKASSSVRDTRYYGGDLGWSPLAGEGVEIREVPGSHGDLLDEPHVQSLAREITDCLARAHRTV